MLSYSCNLQYLHMYFSKLRPTWIWSNPLNWKSNFSSQSWPCYWRCYYSYALHVVIIFPPSLRVKEVLWSHHLNCQSSSRFDEDHIFRTEFCYCNKFTDTCTYIFLWYLSGMEICFCFLDDMIPTPIRITIFVSSANLWIRYDEK